MRYRFALGVLLSIAAAAWCLVGVGVGLAAIAHNSKYLNDVMIPTLVLLSALAAFFIRLAFRLRRRLVRTAGPSEPARRGA